MYIGYTRKQIKDVTNMRLPTVSWILLGSQDDCNESDSLMVINDSCQIINIDRLMMITDYRSIILEDSVSLQALDSPKRFTLISFFSV